MMIIIIGLCNVLLLEALNGYTSGDNNAQMNVPFWAGCVYVFELQRKWI